MNKKTIKLVIVDDHDLFREGLRFVLSKNPDFDIIDEASNGLEYLNKIKTVKPDIVLLDIDMPIMNGINATIKSLELYPDLKIIVLSMHGDQEHYLKMIESGVKGFVLKDAGSKELTIAINEVFNNRNYFSQELLMKIILRKEQSPIGEKLIKQLEISDRELEVLKLLCEAYSNNQIAEKLFISPKTVEGHKAKLMDKTNTTNSVSLVLYAIKNHIVEF